MGQKEYQKISFRAVLIRIFYGIVAGATILVVLNLFSYSKKDGGDKVYQTEINTKYAIYAPVIPDDVTFAGEKLPVENFDVSESLDLEILKTMYWHSEALLYIKRANRFFPIIEPILLKNGVPDDFKFLAVTESGLKNVVSPSNAVGYWQFLKATGKQYGLEITDEVDERYDLEKSTQAACDYLLDSYKKYKNWSMVAASYNMGGGALDAVVKEQKVYNYYDLYLNSETARYVYRIVAYKLILTNPRDYGFVYREKDLYPEIETQVVKVDTTITDFVKFAETYNTNYKMVKLLNPWLQGKQLTNTTKKIYYIHVPTAESRSFDYFEDVIESDSIVKGDSL